MIYGMTQNIMTSGNKYSATGIIRLGLVIYVIALNACEAYPNPTTTGTIIPTGLEPESETKIAVEIEVTEIPPSLTESENIAETAATEYTINFDTETLNNNTLSEVDFDNIDDDTTLPPTTPPPPQMPFSEASIVEIEVIDTNTAAEELDQTTDTITNTTHLIDDDIIAQEEAHPDKKEILNELQNIWYYTEELGEDQTALKSSLSSLIHMTYARVYDQSDETLIRLKYLLRRLRSRLLDQRSKSNAESDPNTTIQPADLENVNISTNSEKSDTNPINNTLEKQDEESPIKNNSREKRSLELFSVLSPQQKTDHPRRLDGDAIFGMVDSDENSLFQPIEKSDKLFYSLMTEKNEDRERVDIPKIPSHSSSGEERIKMAKKVIGGGGQNANNLDENGLNNNFVHFAIYQQDKKKNASTITQNYTTSTIMSRPHPFFSSMSQFGTTTKKPHTNTKYEPIPKYNVTLLKEKYGIVTKIHSTTTSTTTEIPKMNANNFMDDSPSLDSINTMDEIIQSIIDVLGVPIHKPNDYSPSLFPNSQNNSGGLHFLPEPKPPLDQNTGIFDTLPSYLQKLADDLGLGKNSSNSNVGIPPANKNFTKVATISDTTTNSLSDDEIDESLEAIDLSSSSSNSVINGTIEKVVGVISTFSNMSNAARFVLFFSMTVSIASIALGLYSMGPPIVAVGVLGIIVPILLLFMVQNSSGKKKAKLDILQQLKVDDFAQALDMIANAMIKYENN